MNIYSYIFLMSSSENSIKQAGLFKLLSDPTRFRIIDVLLNTKQDLCVNEIANHVGITHSAASHQLAKLESKDIVRSVRNGQTMCYIVEDNPTTNKIRAVIKVAK